MGAIIAGAAIAAVGAGVSAAGAAKTAGATRDAAKFAAYLENKLGTEQEAKLSDLTDQKQTNLEGINSILEKYNGGGQFGDSDVLKNIRSAQSDNAKLAAGDFSAFSSQLQSIMSSTLANTYGSGAAVGEFANLSANNIYNLRQQGLTSALQTGQVLGQASDQLLGEENGLLDSQFNTQYMIERNRVSGITGNQMIAAQQAGTGLAATGQAISTTGGAIAQVGAFQASQANIANQQSMANSYLQIAQANSAAGVANTGGLNYNPAVTPYVPQVNRSATGFGGPLTPVTATPLSAAGSNSYFPLPTMNLGGSASSALLPPKASSVSSLETTGSVTSLDTPFVTPNIPAIPSLYNFTDPYIPPIPANNYGLGR